MWDAQGGSSQILLHTLTQTQDWIKQSAQRGLAGTTGGRKAFVVVVTYRAWLAHEGSSRALRSERLAHLFFLRARPRRSNPRLPQTATACPNVGVSMVTAGRTVSCLEEVTERPARREVWRCAVCLLACACTVAGSVCVTTAGCRLEGSPGSGPGSPVQTRSPGPARRAPPCPRETP